MGAFNSGLGVLMVGAAGSLLAHRVAPVRAWVALVAGIARPMSAIIRARPAS